MKTWTKTKIAKSYFRMAKLLGLSENAAEESLNAMVVAKSIEAKIDRLDGIVDFQQTQDPNEVNKIGIKWRVFLNLNGKKVEVTICPEDSR